MAKKTRRPLTRERVLRAAIELADEGGIEALSMRRLGQELRVEAMSLYGHVASKDDLLSGILDLVVAEIELPSTEHGWKPALRRSAISAKDALLRHPWAGALWMGRQSGGPAGLRRTDWILRTLREAGLSKDLTYHALHIVEALILGVMVQHVSLPHRGEELAGMANAFLQQLRADEYPDLVDHVLQHLEPAERHQGGFELGIDLILDGLERLRDSA